MSLLRASAAADEQMDSEQTRLALRVRRVVSRWPVTALDPIERATFAGAVAQARGFDDLDLRWQELIVAAERGGVRRTYELDLLLHRVLPD